MKKLLILTLVASATLFYSCSKSSKVTPVDAPISVTINGTAYSITAIGTQTWTLQNYKGAGGTSETLTGDLVGTNQLYTYAQVTSIILPSGWRLPTNADYNKLLLYVNGTTDANGNVTASGVNAAKLISSSWPYADGTNTTRFSAPEVGYYDSTTDSIVGQDEATAFWTSTQVANSTTYYGFGADNYEVNGVRTLTAYLKSFSPNDGLSLRFVKDN